MKVLILTHSEVDALLPMAECIPLMADTLAALARGELLQPLRLVINPEDAAGDLALMPAYRSSGEPVYGLKVVGVFPGNVARGMDAHQGSVMLYNGVTGELKALMNASAITAIRTAAVSGVATRLLAREDAATLAIIGAGVEAHTHLAAMAHVRPIKHVKVVSRRIENARRFAELVAANYSFPIEPVETVAAALRDADIIVTATNSSEPVLRREWIMPGAHLNVVGASIPTAREVDAATMAAATLFVDRRESTVNESGDYLMAIEEGAIKPGHIRAELGELLTGAAVGRTSPTEITLFKSLGLAVEDMSSAEYLYNKAIAAGVGAWVEC